MNLRLIERVKHKHAERFGREPSIVAFAPGRVEILGNHTDYNEGFVLSAAVDLGVCLSLGMSGSSDCVLNALDLNLETVFDVRLEKPLSDQHWANYVAGVVAKLNAISKFPEGFNASFSGDIPMDAGLSSSAALEVAAALGLCALYGIKLEPPEIAKLCQAAEHEFAGTNCGLLDQISSLCGMEQALVFTDFRSLAVQHMPLNGDVLFLLADTRVKRKLADSEYNQRRASCEQASTAFASVLDHPVKALRDVSLDEWRKYSGQMDPVIARRALHIIGENQRVLEARKMLSAADLKGFGALMYQSHESSRVNFENSCRELDVLVEEARKLPEVLGARLTGGGFGGSAVLLVRSADAAMVGQKIAARYQDVCGYPCELTAVKPSAAARLL